MLAIQEPYSLLASELGSYVHSIPTMLGSRANVGWVSETIRSKLSSGFPLLVLCTVFAGVPEFGAICDSNFKQPKGYAPAFLRREASEVMRDLCPSPAFRERCQCAAPPSSGLVSGARTSSASAAT